MGLFGKKPENNHTETVKQPTNLELSRAVLELSNEIVAIRTELAKVNGRFGGRPRKSDVDNVQPDDVLWQNATHYFGKDHILREKTWR